MHSKEVDKMRFYKKISKSEQILRKYVKPFPWRIRRSNSITRMVRYAVDQMKNDLSTNPLYLYSSKINDILGTRYIVCATGTNERRQFQYRNKEFSRSYTFQTLEQALRYRNEFILRNKLFNSENNKVKWVDNWRSLEFPDPEEFRTIIK